MSEEGMTVEQFDDLQRAVFLGALQDDRADKSDWIRIWAIMRRQMGLDADPEVWRERLHRFALGHGVYRMTAEQAHHALTGER